MISHPDLRQHIEIETFLPASFTDPESEQRRELDYQAIGEFAQELRDKYHGYTTSRFEDPAPYRGVWKDLEPEGMHFLRVMVPISTADDSLTAFIGWKHTLELNLNQQVVLMVLKDAYIIGDIEDC